MAEAFKCDVVNCNELAEGAPAGRFVAEALGVGKVLCQKHTDEIVRNFFPDLVKTETVEVPVETVAPAESQPTV